MSKKYFLHRISHEWNVAQELLENDYLSIGFCRASRSGAFEAFADGDEEKFNSAFDYAYHDREWGAYKRNQLWRFLNMSVGDIVVIPLPHGEFSICEVIGAAIKVSDLDLSTLKSNRNQLSLKDSILFSGEELVDLGFLLPIKTLKEHLSRDEYADAKLTSRMKYQGTNIRIDDIAESIELVLKAETPINFYETVIENTVEQFLKTIHDNLIPKKFETLVKWLMEKQGFYVEMPAKNESGKTDYADADVIASSELLKLVIYIQVKFHRGTTSDWAIEQITRYAEQKDSADDYTYFRWVITSADGFTEDARSKAMGRGVRLINGHDFVHMIIDAGIYNINEAFE